MTYTSVFGGTTIYPSDVSYAALSLTADTTTTWPLEANTGVPVIARIMDITPSDAYSLFMPDATKTSPGQTVLFNNLGPDTVTIKSYTGVTIASLASGEAWEVYLTSVATTSGSWRTFQMGSITSQAQASALAGYGTVATGSTLSTAEPVTTFNSDYTMGAADRASAYIWTGALGTLSLTSVSALGNNWFADIRNEGSGNLTIDPAASETINSETTLVLTPGDSCRLVTDGTSWYTIGFGQDATFAFDYTLITLPSTGVATYTLSGSELNRIAYKFSGTLTGNIEVIVPNTTQQYWVDNSTTGGSYTLSIATVGQVVPIVVTRDARGIYYCDGTNVVNAATAGLSSPIAITDGGTGATSASGARINLGGTTVGIGVFTAATEGNARAALGSTTVGDALFIAASAGAARTTLGSSVVGDAVFVASTAAIARAALGSTTVGDALFIAASTAAAQTALGTITAPNGGTGQTAYTVGDILYASSTSALSKLGVGTNGQYLTLSGGLPAWATITIPVKASVAEIRAQTDDAKFITALGLSGASAFVTSSNTGSTTLDFAAGNNFQLTLTGNITFNVPSNMANGQQGVIYFIQDATGSRTLTLNASIKKPGGTALTLSTAANSIDRLSYAVRGTTLEVTALEKAFA